MSNTMTAQEVLSRRRIGSGSKMKYAELRIWDGPEPDPTPLICGVCIGGLHETFYVEGGLAVARRGPWVGWGDSMDKAIVRCLFANLGGQDCGGFLPECDDTTTQPPANRQETTDGQ